MDFHSVMETFAEAWVAANTHTPLTEAAEQGLINGPSGLNGPSGPNGPPGPNGHPGPNGPSGHGSFPLHTVPEASTERHEPENPPDTYHGRQSPNDSQNGCTTLSELRAPLKNLSNPHEISKVKSLPIHCIVEQIPGPQACGQYVELDSYAIIPSDTLFNELVRTALVKLGYSDKQILGAKGSIQIRNWKPLAFDQITENPEATLSDILGDMTTVATLHVRLYSVPDNLQEWTDTTVRNAVLELLREMSQSKLAKLCPLSQPMLSNIINNRYMGKIGKEKCQEFGKWYLNYRKQHPEGPAPEIVPCDRPLDGRLTFHPTKELPIMRDWFHACRNPSRRTLQMYVDTLNQGPVRQQERPKVTLMTLKNWWKNEKQRERKQKSESPQHDSTKVKRKRKLDAKIDPQREDSCDGHLQSLDVPEPRNLTVLNNKSSYMDESSHMDHESNIMRKKHNCMDMTEPRNLTILNNKSPYMDESNHMDHESNIMRKKHNCMDMTEPRNLTILNNKSSYIDERSHMDHESSIMRKKHNCLDMTEPRSLTLLNNKPSYLNESNHLDHESNIIHKKQDCLVLHGPNGLKSPSIPHPYIENHSDVIYHKLHPPCRPQSHLVFSNVPESYYGEHNSHKLYCNKITETRDVTDEANGNHMCSENVIVDV